eukprot:102711-Pyramimonas_sp.AAC.1
MGSSASSNFRRRLSRAFGGSADAFGAFWTFPEVSGGSWKLLEISTFVDSSTSWTLDVSRGSWAFSDLFGGPPWNNHDQCGTLTRPPPNWSPAWPPRVL